jgi:hypothetical protein
VLLAGLRRHGCRSEHSRSEWPEGRAAGLPRVIQRLSFFAGFRSKSFHSPFGRAAYFLCSCRESKQRDTPQNIAPLGHPAQRVRAIGRVPLTAHPCAGNGIGAIHRAAPAGLFVRCRRNVMGTRKSQSSAHRARQSKNVHPAYVGARFIAPGSALDPSFDLGVPVSRGEGMTDSPFRVARRMRASSRMDMDVHRANPGMTSRTAEGGAAPGGPFFGYFLCASKESDPLVRGRSGSLCSKAQRTKSKVAGLHAAILPRALRVTRCANVRFGVHAYAAPLRARGNGEQQSAARNRASVPGAAANDQNESKGATT